MYACVLFGHATTTRFYELAIPLITLTCLALQLEAFRKQKGGGKAKGAKTTPADRSTGAENPGPSEVFQPSSTPQPEDGGSAQQNIHSNAADAHTLPLTTSGSQQWSAGGREPVSERPEGGLPTSRGGQDTVSSLQLASSTAASTAPPLFRAEKPAVRAADKEGDPVAAAALAASSTKPLAAPGASSSRGFASMPIPAPPLLPLPPPPPQFHFTISQPPTIPEQSRDSLHSGLPDHSGDRSQCSSDSSGRVTFATSISGGDGRGINIEHGEGEAANSSTAKLERDPFGSIVHPAEEVPLSPTRLSSSNPDGSAQDIPSVAISSGATSSAPQPSDLAGLLPKEDRASPERPTFPLSSAPSLAQNTPVAQAGSAAPVESGAIPAASGYAALSDGYLSPSRINASSPSPARQKEPEQAEVLPVSRSAGLNRLDSAVSGPPSWTSEAARMAPRSMQGPSSLNGYSALSDGYLGSHAGDTNAAESDGHAAVDSTAPTVTGWLGNRGGAAAGSHGGESTPDKQAPLHSGARASEAGSSFAELFDAVLSNSPGPKKQPWFRSPRTNSGAEVKRNQDSDQPFAVRNAVPNLPSPLWQRQAITAGTSSDTVSSGMSGPPPPTAAPTADPAAAEGRFLTL